MSSHSLRGYRVGQAVPPATGEAHTVVTGKLRGSGLVAGGLSESSEPAHCLWVQFV